MLNTASLDEIIACDSDFRIARDSTWFYQGSPIGRQSMVRLFSTILTREEDGSYWLATPAERCRIEVEDVPFQIVAMRLRELDAGETVCFKTNVNEWVALDADHPMTLRQDAETGDVVPYIHVRDGLDARLNRSVYYELMEHMLAHGAQQDGVRGIISASQFFPLEWKA